MAADISLLRNQTSYGSTELSSFLQQHGIGYTIDRSEEVGELNDDLSIVTATVESFARFILGKDTGIWLTNYPPRNYLSEFTDEEGKILNSLLQNRSCCRRSNSPFSREQIQLIYDTVLDRNKRFITPVPDEVNRTEDGERILVTTKATISRNGQEMSILQVSVKAFAALTRHLVELHRIPTRRECLRNAFLCPIALCCARPCITLSVVIVSLIAVGEITGFWWRIQGMEPPTGFW